jgi:hypothetical protein
MGCIFLKGTFYKMCMAYDDIMVLSVEELERFCNTEHYHLCPIYERFQKDGIRTPIEEHSSYKQYIK